MTAYDMYLFGVHISVWFWVSVYFCLLRLSTYEYSWTNYILNCTHSLIQPQLLSTDHSYYCIQVSIYPQTYTHKKWQTVMEPQHYRLWILCTFVMLCFRNRFSWLFFSSRLDVVVSYIQFTLHLISLFRCVNERFVCMFAGRSMLSSSVWCIFVDKN